MAVRASVSSPSASARLRRAGRHQLLCLGLHVGPEGGVRPGSERGAAGQLLAAGDDRLHLEPGHPDAGRFAGLGARDGNVEHRRHATQPRDIIPQVRDVVDAVGVDQEIGQLAVRRIETRVERRPEDSVGMRQRRPLRFQRPDVVVHLPCGRQSGTVECRLHPSRTGLAPGNESVESLVADVVPAVSTFLEAEPGRRLRLQLQELGEFGVEKGRQTSVLGDGGCRGRRLRGGGLREPEIGNEDDRRGDEERLHGSS